MVVEKSGLRVDQHGSAKCSKMDPAQWTFRGLGDDSKKRVEQGEIGFNQPFRCRSRELSPVHNNPYSPLIDDAGSAPESPVPI